MTVPAVLSNDPSMLAWPPTLAIEVALRSSSLKNICQDYGISEDEWDNIRHNPAFVRELVAAVELLKAEGNGFKVRAKLQAAEMLKQSWAMVHAEGDSVPASVKADLIKSTVRWAGYDPQTSKEGGGQTNNVGFKIEIIL